MYVCITMLRTCILLCIYASMILGIYVCMYVCMYVYNVCKYVCNLCMQLYCSLKQIRGRFENSQLTMIKFPDSQSSNKTFLLAQVTIQANGPAQYVTQNAAKCSRPIWSVVSVFRYLFWIRRKGLVNPLCYRQSFGYFSETILQDPSVNFDLTSPGNQYLTQYCHDKPLA